MDKLIVKNSIEINANAGKVWDALINPEQTKVYMFGCEAISEWTPGSELLWKGTYEGKEMVFVKGRVLEIMPEKLLKYTVIEPTAAYPDIPENHLNVIYELTEQNGNTLLTVTQDGFENAADGERRYKDVHNNGDGWNPVLKAIKQLVEAN